MLWLALNRRRKSRGEREVAAADSRRSGEVSTSSGLPFRWRYILLPFLVLLISIAAAAYFYHLLPSEVAFGLGTNSTEKMIGREVFLAMMIVPQFLLSFAGATAAHLIARVGSRYVRDGSASAPPFESIMTVMSNMVVLPQLVLCYAMVDVFVNNAYQFQLPAIYIFGILVMVVGGAILGFFFLKAFQQTRSLRSRRA